MGPRTLAEITVWVHSSQCHALVFNEVMKDAKPSKLLDYRKPFQSQKKKNNPDCDKQMLLQFQCLLQKNDFLKGRQIMKYMLHQVCRKYKKYSFHAALKFQTFHSISLTLEKIRKAQCLCGRTKQKHQTSQFKVRKSSGVIPAKVKIRYYIFGVWKRSWTDLWFTKTNISMVAIF